MKIGVLGSGNGSNFQAVADAIERGDLKGVTVSVVISDNPDAYILERAKKMGIKALYINPGGYKTKLEPDIEKQYACALKDNQVELVVLAGFMRMVKDYLLSPYKGRIVNIHPSLLPAFTGLDSFRQAYDYGVKITGCTVHFVDSGMDTGPIIGQRCVPIYEDDTPEKVHARIQKEEHILYPACIQFIADNKVSIAGRRVKIYNSDNRINNLL